MKMYRLLFIAAATVTMAMANDPAVTGTWQSQSKPADSFVIQRTGDQIHLQEMDGTNVKSEYTCKLGGQDCDVGHGEKVSLWFNGPVLVELRTHHDAVVKRRFAFADGGNQMQLEVDPINPPGKQDQIMYVKK
jgi:hypothetical protein